MIQVQFGQSLELEKCVIKGPYPNGDYFGIFFGGAIHLTDCIIDNLTYCEGADNVHFFVSNVIQGKKTFPYTYYTTADCIFVPPKDEISVTADPLQYKDIEKYLAALSFFMDN